MSVTAVTFVHLIHSFIYWECNVLHKLGPLSIITVHISISVISDFPLSLDIVKIVHLLNLWRQYPRSKLNYFLLRVASTWNLEVEVEFAKAFPWMYCSVGTGSRRTSGWWCGRCEPYTPCKRGMGGPLASLELPWSLRRTGATLAVSCVDAPPWLKLWACASCFFWFHAFPNWRSQSGKLQT